MIMRPVESAGPADRAQQSDVPIGFRCYLLDEKGRISSRVELSAQDDAAATSQAWAELLASKYDAAELWRLGQFLGRLTRPVAVPSPA